MSLLELYKLFGFGYARAGNPCRCCGQAFTRNVNPVRLNKAGYCRRCAKRKIKVDGCLRCRYVFNDRGGRLRLNDKQLCKDCAEHKEW